MSGAPTAHLNAVEFKGRDAQAAALEVLGSLPRWCLTEAPRRSFRTAAGALLVAVCRPPKPGPFYLPVSPLEIVRIAVAALRRQAERGTASRADLKRLADWAAEKATLRLRGEPSS
jgi:hypothetical protein